MFFRYRTGAFAVVLAAAVVAATAGAAQSPTPGTFVSISGTSGIDITINGTGRSDWGFGTAWFDYDNDGDLDLYVASADGDPSWLFEQDDTGHFADVAAARGVADTRNGRAVKFADYDNDGDTDFFLGNYNGPNRLFQNDGSGNFVNVASAAMASGGPTFGGAWGDWDADGWLDLYVVNRVGINQFFHNQGDGTFVEKAEELGINDSFAGLEAVWLDYDNDGDCDLYLSNDKEVGNRLWRNENGVSFTEVSAASGADAEINSMGVAVGDYDNDGDLDIYLTNTTCETCSDVGNVFYRNNGNGTFTNVAAELGMTVDKYSWGVAFLDHDNDGDLDLYVINWSADPNNPLLRDQATNEFYRNSGGGTFFEAATTLGVADFGSGYGLALADYNDDGYVDMFVTNNKWASVFYENVPLGNRWLKIRTIGVESNRDGIGTRVNLWAQGRRQIREVRAGSSYLCQHSTELEWGIKSATVVDSIELVWPSGTVDRLYDVDVNQALVVFEGGPLEITSFVANPDGGGAMLRWSTSRTVGVNGFRVYRTEQGSTEETLITAEDLAPDVKDYLDATARAGSQYSYSLAAVEYDGTELRSVTQTVEMPPAALDLSQNYPNPFNPSTTIAFTLPVADQVTLAVYDGKGRRVRTLAAGEHGAGPHEVEWNGTNDQGHPVASGFYFYRLETSSETLARKMLLVK